MAIRPLPAQRGQEIILCECSHAALARSAIPTSERKISVAKIAARNCLTLAGPTKREVRYGWPMGDSARRAGRIGAVVSATVILLLPALWNGFPLLEWDTGGYLARWFEGYLVPSRSTTYGLFLLAGFPLDFWPVVALQALAAVWVVALLLRTHRFAVHPLVLPAAIAALTLTTSLPWLASELLTDIFAGLAVLGFHILVWRADRVTSRERLALVVFIAFAVSTHSATFAVLIALGAATVLFCWFSAKLVGRGGVAPMIVALALGVVMLLGANYGVSKTFAWTPGGYGLVFARMLQDGIVTRYLNDHCPDPQLKLCPIATSCRSMRTHFYGTTACSIASDVLPAWAMKCVASCLAACATIPPCS